MLSNDLQIVLNAFQFVEHRAPIGRSLLIEQRERTKPNTTTDVMGTKEGKGSSKCTVTFPAERTGDWTHFSYFIEAAVTNSRPPFTRTFIKPLAKAAKVRLRALSEKVECT